MRWEWDNAKSRSNRRAHGFDFSFAEIVFDDPLAISRLDPYPFEERWQTVGTVGDTVVFVVHTWPDPEQDAEGPAGRIVSARKATASERRRYEGGTF